MDVYRLYTLSVWVNHHWSFATWQATFLWQCDCSKSNRAICVSRAWNYRGANLKYSIYATNVFLILSHRQQVRAYCGAERKYQRRQFVYGPPPFLPLVLDHFSSNGTISSVAELPGHVTIEGVRYYKYSLYSSLFMVFFLTFFCF